MRDGDLLLFAALGALAFYLYSRGSLSPSDASNAPDFSTAPPDSNVIEGLFREVLPMSLSAKGAAFIKQQEGGFQPHAYPDANGYSIGYGHFINGSERLIIGRDLDRNSTITQSEADALWNYDVASAENTLRSYVTVPLSQGQHDALIDFIFNEGVAHFASSTLLNKLNSGDYAGAANEFKRWNISSGHVNADLVARRAAEQFLFTSDAATSIDTQTT